MKFDDPGEKNLTTGMHRTCPAQETIDRILAQKSRFGITRVANVTGLDRIGVPVALAIRPNSRSVAVSQGKGVTLEHAKASALMESVEIWHAEHFDQSLRFSCLADLRQRAVDTERLPRTRTTRFSETTRMLWAGGFDLISNEPVLVPHEMVHADYTDYDRPGIGCFPASTNGLASGNHPLEAVCHAICEVIERDALSIMHAVGGFGRVGLSSVEDDDCCAILTRFEDAGLECTILDITSDIGVASFMTLIRERDGAVGHLGLGSGTHLDRNVALRRALTEAAQTRLNYISGSRDDLSPREYSLSSMASKGAAFDSLLSDAAKDRSFEDVPHERNETLQGDLNSLLLRLRAVGIEEVAAVDLTRAGIDIPVVRVVIPGLEAPHDEPDNLPGARASARAAA